MSDAVTASGLSEPTIKLHIGGAQAKEGWLIFDAQPGPAVDIVGDIRDLSAFSDNSCAEVYCSHVLEHVAAAEMIPTLKEIRRIMTPGGRLYISVPDLDVICHLLLSPQLGVEKRYHVMRMLFGGQIDAFDFHKVGLNIAFLSNFLEQAGFASMEQVEYFGLFEDSSNLVVCDVPISLNVIAEK